MRSQSWEDKHRQLSFAGLIVQTSAVAKLEKLQNVLPLIEAANSSGVRLLNEATVDELLAISPSPNESHGETHKSLYQSTLPRPEQDAPHGRVLAPILATSDSTTPRPRSSSGFNSTDFPLEAKEVDSEIEIHFDITGQSSTEGRISDMQSCFKSRLAQIRSMMISGGVLPRRPISNSEAWRNRRRLTNKESEFTIIGLSSDVRWTKNGWMSFVLEDESTQIRCMIKPPSDASSLHPSIDGLMDDEIVGVSGNFSSGEREPILWVQNIHKPPLGQHSKSQAGEEMAVSAAFLSDVHLGSKTFLAPQWDKMVQWFKNDPLAKTVKYFVLTGDGVDGVGIYPGQERHLAITDLFNQYGELARMLEEIPDWVDVVMLPGNHDAVRPAEPQPALDPEVQQDYSNTTFVGNPCDFSLHGVRVLSYHGKSIDDFVATLRSVTYSKPEMAMRAMLERRHLAPSWGGKTPLSPEPEDRMVIPVVPDIFVTGHVHGHFVGDHKGTLMVHSSTWQDQTDFQRMLGFQPKPCILTVVNLHTFATESIDFV